MGRQQGGSAGASGRRDRLLLEKTHDPYKSNRKLPDPTLCPDCDAVFASGRWSWRRASTAENRAVCPACQRIRDGYPAARILLKGEFQRAHRDEILALARNIEEREKAQHPLKRIMAVQPVKAGLRITTTDQHLGRTIGDAIHAAYAGDLAYEYTDGENLLRVTWTR